MARPTENPPLVPHSADSLSVVADNAKSASPFASTGLATAALPECYAPAGTGAGESIGEVQRRDRVRAAGAHPAEPGEDPAEHHQELRSEAVDEPAFEGHQPCLEQDEDR